MSADIRSLLLETLTSPGGRGALPSAQDLLTQLGEADPTVRLIAQLLTQRQAQELENETPTEEEVNSELSQSSSAPDEAEMRSSEMSRAFRQLRQKIESMYTELAELRERNDAFAAALGACYLCWGNDPECEICNGQGRPGSSTPDKKLFTQFAVPAARRLQRGEGATHRFSKTADQHLSPSQSLNQTERREL
jgi:DNA repair exonuclease SbcCD ATPase subunit